MNEAIRDDVQNALREPQRAYKPETIVLALQDDAEARAALPIAREVAQLQEATLHLVCLRPQKSTPRVLVQQMGLTAEELSGGVVDQVVDGPDEVVRVATSFPSPLIVACTYDTEQQYSFGSVSDAVLSTAPQQVLLVSGERPPESWTIRRIILAHDGSPSADAATGITASLAHRAGAQVVALHVAARRCAEAHEPGSFPAPMYVDQPQHEWPAWANEFMQRMMALGASPGAVNFQLLVAGGQPGSEIAQFARDNKADLVVMAWHGRWEAERAGTMRVVARRSDCPVLLICTSERVSSEVAA